MKLYDKIYKLLSDYPQLRDSDKKLIWTIWYQQGLCKDGYISKEDFVSEAENCENIRRTRQKCQEDHPEVRSSALVQEMKDKKQASKGTFVYREQVDTREEMIDFSARMEMFQRAKDELAKKGFHFK